MMKNIGRFYVSNVFFHDLRPGDGTNLFHGMVIYETTRDLSCLKTEYLAIHEDFEDIRDGWDIPEYKPVFNKTSAFPRWVKVF